MRPGAGTWHDCARCGVVGLYSHARMPAGYRYVCRACRAAILSDYRARTGRYHPRALRQQERQHLTTEATR